MIRNEYEKIGGPFFNGIKTSMCCCISVGSACPKSPIFPYIFDHLPYISPIFIQNPPIFITIFSREVI